jgi:hypothetical protein
MMIASEIFGFFRRIPNPISMCKGFRDTNHMEKLAAGRVVAKDVESFYPEISSLVVEGLAGNNLEEIRLPIRFLL